MTLLITLRIELPCERGPERHLRLGRRLTLGRPMPDQDGTDRLVVPGRWLGVRQEGMVSAELLRIVYQDLDEGRAVLGWRTRAQHHPTVIRVTPEPTRAGPRGSAPYGASPGGASPGGDPDLAAEGRIMLGPGEVRRLLVSRLSAEHRRFVTRFAVQLAASGHPTPPPDLPEIPDWRTLIENGHWLPLVEGWWTPQRPEVGLTWQRCLSVTSRLVADGVPSGTLASAVAQSLRLRGFPQTDPIAVRRAWTRAMTRLVELLGAPDPGSDLSWMVTALAVPGLAEHLAALSGDAQQPAGTARPRLPAGETQIRSLVVALRATGRTEWR